MTSSEKITNIRYAYLFEEFDGPLKKLFDQDGALIALIGKNHLALPPELEQSLRPLLGRPIAIIRTDLPQREYIPLVLTQEPNCDKND